jgi:Predicted aminoglycoside phosphotransferase
MESRTKRRLSPEQLRALIGGALGAGVTSTTELTDGLANAAWRVGLDDGRSVVLKVGPPPGLEQLSYERELLRTEAMVYRLAASAGLPQAELLHSSFDDPLIGGDYLIISALDGVPWSQVTLPDADDRAVRYELGRLLARLHAITGEDGSATRTGRCAAPPGGTPSSP